MPSLQQTFVQAVSADENKSRFSKSICLGIVCVTKPERARYSVIDPFQSARGSEFAFSQLSPHIKRIIQQVENKNTGDSSRNTPKSDQPDVIVIGAGIFGLWAARHALKRGERVLVVEKRSVGAGASGGFLGALMPHMPDNWNAKKQFQYEALASLADAIGDLEAHTGHDCGYRRCGRLMPLTHEKMLAHAQSRIEGVKANWVDKAGKQAFKMQLISPEDLRKPEFGASDGKPWLDPGLAEFGATIDTLSARVNPRAYLEALAAYVRSKDHKGEILEGVEVVSFTDDQNGVSVQLASGESISGGRLVVANGWEAYGLLAKAEAKINSRLLTGRGVKGQAVLLDFAHDDQSPIVYDNGSYVVPHSGNKVAIGSTSIDNWLPLGLGNLQHSADERVSETSSGADHPELPASVEPAQNRPKYFDGPLPQFTEMTSLASHSISAGLSLSSESFVGDLTLEDPLAAKLVEASVRHFEPSDMEFYNHAVALCPSLAEAPITERWANVRPRNTIPDPKTGKTGTEPVFGTLDGSKQVQVMIGGFKISFGIGHAGFFDK